MNSKWMKKKSDKRAEMGVGTMIIFIAMVLVAAVAASVIISTANSVREQAQSTGSDAVNNIATGFTVQDVVGQITDNEVTEVTIYMRLSAGSPNINMDNVMISVTTNDNSNYLNMSDDRTTASANESFGFAKTLDVQGYDIWVLGQGDLAKITITGLNIGFNQLVTIKIIPAYGQMSLVQFTTPEQYSSQYITLS